MGGRGVLILWVAFAWIAGAGALALLLARFAAAADRASDALWAPPAPLPRPLSIVLPTPRASEPDRQPERVSR